MTDVPDKPKPARDRAGTGNANSPDRAKLKPTEENPLPAEVGSGRAGPPKRPTAKPPSAKRITAKSPTAKPTMHKPPVVTTKEAKPVMAKPAPSETVATEPKRVEPLSAPQTPDRRLVRPVTLVLIAAISLLAAYVLSSTRTDVVGAGDPAATLNLNGFYPIEVGPRQLRGRWMADVATITASGQGTYWLALLAVSNARTRSVSLSPRGGAHLSFSASRGGGAHIVGPLELAGSLPIGIAPQPGAQTPGSRDRRRLSVFVTPPRLVSEPLAALPADGFYAADSASPESFSWLMRKATIEIVAADPAIGQAWISFNALPVSPEGGSLRIQAPGTSLAVTPAPTGERVVFGPITITGGRATVALSVAEPVPAVNTDLWTFRIGGVQASTDVPERTVG